MQSNLLSHRLVAHRGDQQRYPENSLSAFQAAVADGCHYLEFDVQLSADLTPMVYHDTNLQRTSGIDGAIHDSTSAELARFTASEPARLGQNFCFEPIPTLHRVIEWFQFIRLSAPTLQLFVEIKEESIERFGHQRVLEAIKPVLAPVCDAVIIISFDAPLLTLLHNSEYRTGLILRQWPAVDSNLSTAQPDYLIINKWHIAADERLDDQPLPVMVYEIENEPQAEHWLKRGASLLESFNCNAILTGSHSPLGKGKDGPMNDQHLACSQP